MESTSCVAWKSSRTYGNISGNSRFITPTILRRAWCLPGGERFRGSKRQGFYSKGSAFDHGRYHYVLSIIKMGYSIEIPTRCSFVIEFIIPKFIEGSAGFERHTAHHQSSWWWAVCRSKHVEPSINFGIINSITKLHLIGISTESSTMHGSMNIKMG